MSTQESSYPRSSAPAWALVMLTMLAVAGFLAFLWPDIARGPGLPEQARKAGNQAPPERRGTFQGGDTYQPKDIPSTNAAIDAYNATEEAKYQDAVGAPLVPTLAPLPLNSAGQPVISEEQQAQMNQARNFAEAEALDNRAFVTATAAAAQLPTVLSRAPDVSAAEVATMTGRDPCHVPHADPHTCASGLYKPTPVK